MNKNYNIYDAIFEALYFKKNKIEFSITNFIKTFFVIPALTEIFFKMREKLLEKFEELKKIKMNFKETKINIKTLKTMRKIATESHFSNAPPIMSLDIKDVQNG